MMQKTVFEKVFFGKDNAFKLNLNDEGNVYFELGSKEDNGDDWAWKSAKMSDEEIGEIINVLENNSPKASFYHEFEGDKTQIWVNRKDKYVFVKIGERSKSLNEGQQTVLRELLTYAVLRSNMEL
jgi:hypothetical protein